MSLGFKQSFKLIDDMLDYKDKHSIILAGPYGTGKSTCFGMVARKRNIPFVDMRLSQCDVGDLKGMPFHIKGRTYFAPPDWFPLQEADLMDLQKKLHLDAGDMIKHADAGILCLDEIDRANREVQQAGFELVNDRRLGGKPIMPGWVIGAGINADGDVYLVNDMDVAFIDRFVYVNFAPTKDEWFEFARNEGKIHEAVINFLASYPDFMDTSKEIILNNPGKKLYSRRSWERLSQFLYNFAIKEKAIASGVDILDGSILSTAMLNGYAEMYVGESVAGIFGTYIQSHYKVINADAILNKWDAKIEKEVRTLIADKEKATVLASLGRLVSDYVEDKKVKVLSDSQSANLAEFINILPNECAGNFFKQFNFRCKEVSTLWFTGKYKSIIAAKIKSSLSNPETGKGVKA